MKKYLLLSLAMAVALPAYAALDCATPPTCAELGYTQSASDCAGQFILKCPFDETAVFCGGDTPAGKCMKEGYTVTSCGEYENKEACPHDPSLFMCTPMTTREMCIKDGYEGSCDSEAGYYIAGLCPHDQSFVKCEIDTCPSGYIRSEICRKTGYAIIGGSTTGSYVHNCTYGITTLSVTSVHLGAACYNCGVQQTGTTAPSMNPSQSVFCGNVSTVVPF